MYFLRSGRIPNLDEYYRLAKNPNSKEYRKALKKLLSQKIKSKEYFRRDRTRKELHKEILNSKIDQYPENIKPSCHFLLGSIGSGKTSVLSKLKKNVLISESEFITINLDLLKAKLPEYELLKKIDYKKAADFVQTESAHLAGDLFKEATRKKINIIFEKNIVMGKRGDFQLTKDIEKTFKENYLIYIHIIFLDNFTSAWQRVQNRTQETKRFVPKEKVKETFLNLFPNFNSIYRSLKKKSFLIFLWYNGDKMPFLVSLTFHGDNFSQTETPREINKYQIISEDSFWGYLAKSRLQSLDEQQVESLKKLDFLKKSL